MRRIGRYRENSPIEPERHASIYAALEHPLDQQSRDILSNYLRNAPTIAATSPGFTDAISGKDVKESKNLHSNGLFIWNEDLAYYVERYGLDPGPEIFAHAKAGIGLGLSQTQIVELADQIWEENHGNHMETPD